MDNYQSEEEIRAVVEGFESCATGKDDFKHRGHLTVAVWHLRQTSPTEALNKIRAGLFRFLDYHDVGRGKYNETLTIFWVKLVQKTMSQMEPGAPLVHSTNTVLERLSDPSIVFEYYSEACLKSASAKTGWVEPDLKLL